ncbi:hypothetical protein BDP55DRAFT_635370 [Colletotrichum godetiae]|uniref:RRM domain-containing protein n=1 Tax=Colletotrichum godetiae TaxID=1209918 RepID=A0AAJ0ES40_9PEZI|nr:uncharacterized protein BDP55DRAFT_635370 [Colletotrichum godetiae]KAK1671948.1 hypothetical protein BDP55DRAFT_635370 [Colletotrichum godetiae]
MVYSQAPGMKGKMGQSQMQRRAQNSVLQFTYKPRALPETVMETETAIDNGEHDSEPGGACLDADPFGRSQQSQHYILAGSSLNPSSSPWVPNSQVQQTTSKIDQSEIAELNGTRQYLGTNGKTEGHLSIPAQNFGSGSNGAASSLDGPVETGYRLTRPKMPSQANHGQLTGSSSMGNLGIQTPVRQNNVGLLHNQGGKEVSDLTADDDHDFETSPGSDTPKAKGVGNIGLMTEPRNFAPRTMSHLGAPPKFNLIKVHNGVNTPASGTQDPFVSSASHVGAAQPPMFGSQIDTTHLLATGQIPFPAATGDTLHFDNLPRDDAEPPVPNNTTGQVHQPNSNNGGHAANVQNMPAPAQQAGLSQPQLHAMPLAGNSSAIVPYHVPYQAPYQGTFQGGYQLEEVIATYGDTVPDYIRAQRSTQLNRLTGGPTGRPTANEALHQVNFPFVESPPRASHFVVRGVIKIGNIPFVTNRSEIIAILGRNSRMLNDTDEPVHIIMERVTGKTTDAYVEFDTLEDASKAVEKHHQNLDRGRVTRIGQRPVEIELSSQAALMKDLFPNARGVFWAGLHPHILPNNDEEPWDNFKGFVSNEEMTMLVKHVEVPHRSPFSKECPQRPFECLISTLTKFPWQMKNHVTIQQRHAMYKATCDLLRILVGNIRDKRDEVNLTHRLVKRVVAAAMRCEGFSITQKDDIAFIVDMSEMEQRSFGQPRFAESWRHLYVLVPKNGIPLDVIEWYLAVIREETTRNLEMQSFQEKCQTCNIGDATDGYFGFFWRELNLRVGPDFDRMTLATLAMHEYQTLEAIIRRALTPTLGH